MPFLAIPKIHFAVQQFIHCQPGYFSTIHIIRLVHINTSDPTHNRAELVCDATQSLWCIQTHPTQHTSVLTPSIMPPIHKQPIIMALKQNNHFRLSVAMFQVYTCARVPTCTLFIKQLNYQFPSSIHYYSNTTSQQWHNASKSHQAVTSHCGKTRNNLAAAEQQSRYSGKHPPLGLSNLNHSDAVWTVLAATRDFHLNSQSRHSNCTLLIIIRAYSSQRDSFSQQRVLLVSKVHKSNLLVATSSNLAATSSNDFQETLVFPQDRQHTISIVLLQM